MVQATRLGLTRIVLLSPLRRVDLAVPEYLPLVNLQPALLRHGGVGLADEGIAHHGWVLRRVDGTVLDSSRSLAAQGVTDGESILLAPQDQEWPEPAYDDLADAVAYEAQQLGAVWSGRHTRRAGVIVTMAVLVGGLLLALRSGPGWTVPGLCLSAAALVVLAVAAVAARVRHDPGIALMLSITSYAYLAPGLALLATGEPGPGPAQLLVAGVTLVCAAVIALIAVGAHRETHVAVLSLGALGSAGALLSMLTTPPAAAAIVAAALLLGSPWLPRIASRRAGIPVPTIPRPSTDTPVDEPLPAPAEISSMVRLSDELLTSLLWGMCAGLLGCVAVLSRHDDTSSRLLAVVIVIVCALRGRAFAAVRHRVPLLTTALAGGLALLLLSWESVAVATRLQLVAVVLGLAVLGAVGAYTAGRTYAVRQPSPQLGRLGDITEFTLIALSGVLAAAVTGLFGYMRGLGG